uniref:CASAMP N-terminal domain-containing protein n=1 Tax=Ciona savignyi TaxID=51511 RepID=H2YGV2_CIOSA
MKEYNVSESDGNYNVDEAKIRCSVTWLLAMVKMKHESFNVGLMFDEGGNVTKDLQDFLVSGWPYRECIRMIFNDNILNNGFDDVIQVLCRHEFYVLKENDTVLTSEQLTQCPINLRSHVQLI